jgi:dipeptidyl aminopeptidase/acylaminoacyl peptidase
VSATRFLAAWLVLPAWFHSAQAQSSTTTQYTESPWPTFGDLAKLRHIDEISVSADGNWVAYVAGPVFDFASPPAGVGITFLNLKDGRKRMVDLAGRPHHLAWSPQGQLSFLMKTPDRGGIWSLGPRGSETRLVRLASRDSAGEEILAYSWNSAGDSLAYLVAAMPALKSAAGSFHEQQRLILFRDVPGDLTGPTDPPWARDSIGAYLVVSAIGGDKARVVRPKVVSRRGDPDIRWLSTGEIGVVGIRLDASLDQMFFERGVTLINPETGATRALQLQPEQAPRNPAWAPSGRRLAFLNLSRPTMDLRRPMVDYALHAVARRAGTAQSVLSQHADGLLDLAPLWSADERTLYIGRYQRASARLYTVDVSTRQWKLLTPDTLSVSHYVLANDGKHLIVAMENANQPRELFRLDPGSGRLTRLTHEGDSLARYPLGQVEAVSWPSADRRFTVHGFLLKPAGYALGRRYPLIVLVHGGPGAFHSNSFMGLRFNRAFAPAQLLSAAGYLVLLPNPRGDTSYGPEFQIALNGDLASGPFHDVDSGVSALLERGLVDSTAIALYGASYGAYLTAYAVSQTHRYAAAAIDDGPMNLSSIFGQSYGVEIMFLKRRLGGNLWARPEIYAAQSPTTFVDRVRTPVLMRYGGRSACGVNAIRLGFLAQGLEYYAGLKESNVPVEFVVHPDQGHGIADWELYRDWVGRTLTWFGRWRRTGSHEEDGGDRMTRPPPP